MIYIIFCIKKRNIVKRMVKFIAHIKMSTIFENTEKKYFLAVS